MGSLLPRFLQNQQELTFGLANSSGEPEEVENLKLLTINGINHCFLAN